MKRDDCEVFNGFLADDKPLRNDLPSTEKNMASDRNPGHEYVISLIPRIHRC